jgi:hypothetical protein
MRHRFDASPELIDAIRMPGLPSREHGLAGGNPVDGRRTACG